jgi:hypothetical protein
MSEQTDHIRRLNDMARTQPQNVNATWVMTQGVRHLLAGDDDNDAAVAPALQRVAALRAAIATYSDWSEDNDPHGEHDFGHSPCSGNVFSSRLIIIIPTTTRSPPCPAISRFAAASSRSCWPTNIEIVPSRECRYASPLDNCRNLSESFPLPSQTGADFVVAPDAMCISHEVG